MTILASFAREKDTSTRSEAPMEDRSGVTPLISRCKSLSRQFLWIFYNILPNKTVGCFIIT